jgi:hypothetical protein
MNQLDQDEKQQTTKIFFLSSSEQGLIFPEICGEASYFLMAPFDQRPMMGFSSIGIVCGFGGGCRC